MEDNDAANKAFATSLALWPQLAEGWLSWGTFCDKQVSFHISCSVGLNFSHPTAGGLKLAHHNHANAEAEVLPCRQRESRRMWTASPGWRTR